MGATALNVSTFGTGQQQRADIVFAETTFVCPPYWLAEAFTNNNRVTWKYQYSVILAQHGSDKNGYIGRASPNQEPDFARAFMTIWGNFITKNDPSIPVDMAAGAGASSPAPSNSSIISTDALPSQPDVTSITQLTNPGLRNDFTLVNVYTWEGGRGVRCDFWRSVGRIVPE
ncbi:MAG: hypothetical protein Q9173_002786 [Seirophora scorigena]